MSDKKSKKFVPPGLTYIADNITTRDNILGLQPEAKAKWAAGLEFSNDKSTVFFAGCGYQYSAMLDPLVSLVRTADKMVLNPDLPIALAGIPKKLGVDVAGIYGKVMSRGENGGDSQVLRDAVAVLNALNIKVAYLGDEEPCCGAPLFHTGLRREFAANAEKSYARLKKMGVKKIIGIVPSCTYALRNLFPQVISGFDIEVSHFIEEAAANIGRLKLKLPQAVKVAYHDPCQLSRYMKLTDQPRKVIKAIENVELVEPEWTSGEWSTCCGGGGGFEVVFPGLSQTMAESRVKELEETGADIITTQCPGCLMQLKQGVKPIKRNIEVLDLASLLARAVK